VAPPLADVVDDAGDVVASVGSSIRAGLARPLIRSSSDLSVVMPFLLASRSLKVRLGTGGLTS
jgi:hypothetical protein